MPYKAVVNSFDDAVIAMDFDGRILCYNTLASDVLQIKENSALGKLIYEVVPEHHRADEKAIIEQLKDLNGPYSYEAIYPDKSGAFKYYSIKIIPLIDDTGNGNGFLRIAKDQTKVYKPTSVQETNQRLADHLKHTPLAVIEWSRDLFIDFWSENAEALFGYSKEEMIGHQLHEFEMIHPEDIAFVQYEVGKLVSGQVRNQKIVNRNITKNGKVIVCEWYNSALYDVNNNMTSILSLVLDVTDKKAQEQKLRKNELSLREAQRLSRIGHWEWDPETNQVYNSEQLLSIFGRSLTFQSFEVPDLFTEQEWRKIYPLLHYLFTHGKPFVVETEFRHPSGEIKYIKARGSRRKVDDNNYVFHGTIQDISERKRAELKTLREKGKLEILLEGTTDAIVLLDNEFKIVLYNQIAQKNFQYLFPNSRLHQNASLSDLINGNQNEWLEKIYNQLSFDQTIQFDLDVPMPNGLTSFWQATVYPIFGITNELQHICLRFLNIDELKKATLERDFQRITQNALINNSHDLIWSIDKNFNIIAANESFALRYKELTNHEFVGGCPAFPHDELPLDYVDQWKSNYLRAFRGECFLHVSSANLKPYTPEQVNETSFNPIREGKEIVGVACQSRNITQRLAQEKALERASFLLKQSQQVARIGNWVLYFESPEQKIVTSSETLNILGLTSEPAQGLLTDYFEFAHELDKEPLMALLQTSFEKGTPLHTQFRVIHPNNRIIWVEIQAEISFDETINERFMIGVAQDVTAQFEIQERIHNLNIELESKVKERTLELERVNKELESFSYSVSHDLRAPLRAIHGYASILQEEHGENISDDSSRLLQNIQTNAKQMGTLIDELLDFARIGKKELQLSPINMNELVEQIVLEINAGSKHNTKLRIAPLKNLNADASMISRVWANLIMNAIKYSRKKEAPEVTIDCTEQDGFITYRVKDNGAGFDMAYYSKLFGVFQRLHTPREFEGTGVGLAIVEKIISKHGGKIWAESEVENGATFYFSLPERK